jgi:Domain of unknown function (DUF4276)
LATPRLRRKGGLAMKKLKIGVIGEHPANDAQAIINLLQPHYGEKAQFKVCLKNFTGDDLSSAKFLQELKRANFQNIYDFVLIIRDLDGLPTQTDLLEKKQDLFQKYQEKLNGIGIFMLNIFELEALILSDLTNFNKRFKTKFSFQGNPAYQNDPKGLLKSKSDTKYQESDAIDLFKSINIVEIRKKHSFFNDFCIEFEQKIKFS